MAIAKETEYSLLAKGGTTVVNLEKIGQRIKEQRKHIAGISQEKMAEDLGMYQADISNLEKAKSGSGIADLMKLDLIADYFHIPLETLLFGREESAMLTYYGSRMRLSPGKRKPPKEHLAILRRLLGFNADAENLSPEIHECGPYTIYSVPEYLVLHGGSSRTPDGSGRPAPEFWMPRLHTYIFLDSEVIAVMVCDITTVMQHVYQPVLGKLQGMIPTEVLDVTDVMRTLNPHWALWHFEEDAERKEEYKAAMFERMNALRDAGEDRRILYVESVYIREDCRRHGLFRMYTDYLKMQYSGCVIWLNLEPTSGEELAAESRMYTMYSIAEVGQIHINAAIAEKVGFTVDPDPWHMQAEVPDDEGRIRVEPVVIQ